MSEKKTTVDGKTVNQRTADMLALWQFNALQDFYVVQGSYNKGGVSQSAGTHDGGGALDISVYGWDYKHKRWVETQGRLAGFAAYYRETIPGLWNEHIHAIAVGDPELSYGAQRQVVNYRAGDNALASHLPDTGKRLHPIPVYPNTTLKKVSLLSLRRQWNAKKPKPTVSVARVQWVLNEKAGTHLATDGVVGPKTKAAYVHYSNEVGGRADGTPGRVALRILGKGRFTVSLASYEKWRKAHTKKTAQLVHEARTPTFRKK